MIYKKENKSQPRINEILKYDRGQVTLILMSYADRAEGSKGDRFQIPK
jgi:hypothetical protein